MSMRVKTLMKVGVCGFLFCFKNEQDRKQQGQEKSFTSEKCDPFTEQNWQI